MHTRPANNCELYFLAQDILVVLLSSKLRGATIADTLAAIIVGLPSNVVEKHDNWETISFIMFFLAFSAFSTIFEKPFR